MAGKLAGPRHGCACGWSDAWLVLKAPIMFCLLQWGFTGCFDRENGGSFLVGEHSVAGG